MTAGCICPAAGNRADFQRSIAHWKVAAVRLADLDLVASPQAWSSLEHYLGVSLRSALTASVARLNAGIVRFESTLASPGSVDVAELQRRLVDVRTLYFRAETTVDFYADCLATRAVPRMSALLRACDHISTRAMAEALAPMGRQVPAALTYVDKGLGASILKFDLRLWDGTITNPVSTIKITRHHLLRPCSALHESGHQVAHTLGWVPELAQVFRTQIGDATVGAAFAAWASEIAADAYAHVHCGYGAALALHDVLDGSDATVLQWIEQDPHPISYLRVLMVLEMCRQTYGDGPWDRLAAAWAKKHRVGRATRDVQALIGESLPLLPRAVQLLLFASYRAFGNRPLTALVDPRRVSPTALEQLAREAGSSAFTSTYWTWNEAIRLLALTSYRAGQGGRELQEALQQQESWMLRLGMQRAA